ncbi:MAG: hypothetical protein K2Y07_05055 [Nitrosomonas sp.]|nr:hypothetical protein [Nitrosomonas sp.]
MAGTHSPVLEIVRTVITSVLMARVAGVRVLDANDNNGCLLKLQRCLTGSDAVVKSNRKLYYQRNYVPVNLNPDY